MDSNVLRHQLTKLLEGANAHISFQNAVKNFPMDHINMRAAGIPYSCWELIEHMRIAQYDILDFIRNPEYSEMKWPDEYWPAKDKEATAEIWQQTIKIFENDLDVLKDIVKDPGTDFTGPLPHAPKYNILREILLVADHNAYHTGQIITIRRALNIY